MKKINFPWLYFVKTEFHQFIKEASLIDKSLKRIVEREVGPFASVSDEDVKLKFENTRLSRLYGLFDIKEKNYISKIF